MAAPARLLRLDARTSRYLVRMALVTTGLFVGAVAIVVGLYVGLMRDDASFLGLMAFWGGGSAALFFMGGAALKRLASLLDCLLASRRPTGLKLDEGGIRVEVWGRDFYLPFEELDEPLVIGRWLGGVTLLVGRAGEPATVRLALFHPDAIGDAHRLARDASAGIALRRRPLPAGAQLLERSGLSLSEWRAQLERAARPLGAAGAFRSAALTTTALRQLTEDPALSATVRAGALYALLHAAPGEGAHAVDAVLSESSPPILVAMAALHPSGAERIERSLLAAAEEYVDEELREALRRSGE